ncbi:hypothetical protein StoSoilB3_15570 [Arthrobacter sp. StoSoilB3]|nr:hypothetical protein StoSoilB3_15570 [Arthrobacter sp. StoSoilB3]GGV30292.1 hypothetical protein GCM10010212_16160 [Paenarthrobacter nicotinovorans]
MLVDLEAEADFLQNRIGLVLAGFAGLDGGFVLVLAEVHQLANRRLSLRRNFNEIEIGFGSKTQCVLDADNSYLFAGRADQPHLGDADTLIDSWLANVKAPVVVVVSPANREGPQLLAQSKASKIGSTSPMESAHFRDQP